MEKDLDEGITYYADLNDEGRINYPSENILQIVAGDKIIFHISAGAPIANKVHLLVNQPKLGTGKFGRRSSMALLRLKKRSSSSAIQERLREHLVHIDPLPQPSGAIEFVVEFSYSGSFFYQIEYFDKKLERMNFTEPDWIVVHPRLETPNKTLKAESLTMQTVYPRCLGKVKNWPKVIDSQAKLGYNAIHFVPIQKYGSSGSMYSLRNQISIDDCYYDDPGLPDEERIEQVYEAIKEINDKSDMLCFIDIVLNHTATDSDWLLEHPDGAYNLHNCPFFKVAWEFDKFLAEFSRLYAEKKVPECQYAPYIGNESDLRAVINALDGRIKKLPLEQYFLYDRNWVKEELKNYLANPSSEEIDRHKVAKVNLVDYVMKHSSGYGSKPHGVIIKMYKVGPMLVAKLNKGNNFDAIWKELNGILDHGDNHWRGKYYGYMKEALHCIEGGIRYEKIQCNNPVVSDKNPLVKPYFTQLKGTSSEHEPDEYVVAHNGWVMVTEDFATPLGFHYLRRVIVIWDDSVKLYYGEKKEDSPYLWSHMEKYVGDMATIFQGVRIDNCHSTPLHVLEYFVNYARSKNPSLYVFAELFTKDARMDAVYVRRIGLNALIRESVYVNNAWSLSDTIGKAVGAVTSSSGGEEIYLSNGQKAEQLVSSHPKALIYDITHDNESPMHIWNPQAILPLFCSLAMANIPVGSTRGVDELIPKSLSVVTEKRLYQTLPDIENTDEPAKSEAKEAKCDFVYRGHASKIAVAGTFNNWSTSMNLLEREGDRWRTSITLDPGKYYYKYVVDDKNWVTGDGPTERDSNWNVNNVIIVGGGGVQREGKMAIYDDLRPIRKIMNTIHSIIGNGKSSMGMNVMDDVIVITQQLAKIKSNEDSGYVLIARTNFNKGSVGYCDENVFKSVQLPGKLSRVLLTCNMYIDQGVIHGFSQNHDVITGVKGKVYNHLNGSGLKHFANVKYGSSYDTLEFFKMPASLCVVVSTKLSSSKAKTIEELEEMTNPPVAGLSMGAINHLLFRCNSEEQEFSKIGRTIYEFRGIAPKFAGIAGLVHEFIKCRSATNACDPIFNNVKEGNWLIDYHLARVKDYSELSEVYSWMEKYLSIVKDMPVDLKPKWFVKVIMKLFFTVKMSILKTAPEVYKHDEFYSGLLLSTYHFMGCIPSAVYRNHKVTMSAGLPHFAVQFFRCWGRDTMIALPGILITPGRVKEARDIIIMFAEVSRHGLIPNLHSQGKNARFNARDATWFFMESLQQYIKRDKENGPSIFKEKLDMEFLSWDQKEHERKLSQGEKYITTMEDLVQQIMQAHFQGIDFVEWNAGKRIDEHMTSEGFHISIRTDRNTGFIYGGNRHNCGTWMDKMGSSEKARNKGVPGSSRDGADIEIIGLLRSALRFLAESYKAEIFPYEGVKYDDKTFTYEEWGSLIDKNFEKHFWIPKDTSEWNNYHIDRKYVQQTNIYKDVIGASDPGTDYRFRPNIAIALAVAPEMFDKEHARAVIAKMREELISPDSLGIKTLHPADKDYRPRYVNNDDGTDFATAHGLCYHMGPEWVWPFGFFLKAMLMFEEYDSKDEMRTKFMGLLKNHRKHLLQSPWMGLPELTNANGEENPFSCMTQAWSTATIIDAIDFFNKCQ
jgi:glycogen debranching enzyme